MCFHLLQFRMTWEKTIFSVKPSLKKVSKYDNKFKKMAEAKKEDGSKNLRNNLKTVKKESVFTQIANKVSL